MQELGYSHRPILVTGSHNSGTSWVGRMLALPAEVGYIYEPFNLRLTPGICGAEFRHWFTYVTHENEQLYAKHIERTLSFRISLRAGLRAIRQRGVRKGIRELAANYRQFSRYRQLDARPLVKDPIALLSAEWLADRFDMQVVILIRHPAAFVGSVKKRGWTHSYADFLAQPLLMRDHLAPYEAEIQSLASRCGGDIIENAAVLWRLLYIVVSTYQRRRQDWVFVRHEDISRDPVNGFNELYSRLGLPFTRNTKDSIRHFSNGSSSHELLPHDDPLKRDSRANIWSWKDRLTDREVARIRRLTEDVAPLYYADGDWDPDQ